jgi:8-hydroxy-5-deazaflavin:NADPH oxidoreductase
VKIGIIGSGNVGGTLGRRWAKNGHAVIFSTREPSSAAVRELLAQAGPTAKSASVRDAARESEVLLLATPWEAAQNALASAGDLTGKILIDATNPLLPGLGGLAVGTTTSAGEMVAKWAAGAKVVKAFNTVGFNIMADPRFEGGRAAMFYCGDDAKAKSAVAGLINELVRGPGCRAADAVAIARAFRPFMDLARAPIRLRARNWLSPAAAEELTRR